MDVVSGMIDVFMCISGLVGVLVTSFLFAVSIDAIMQNMDD